KLRAASEYVGDEIVIASFMGANGRPQAPVFLAESRRNGFAEFLQQNKLPLQVETRNGLVAFGPVRESVAAVLAALDAPTGGFSSTPFYSRIEESYRNGAGILIAADLGAISEGRNFGGVRYFIGEEKQVSGQMEARASIGFDGERTGIASW